MRDQIAERVQNGSIWLLANQAQYTTRHLNFSTAHVSFFFFFLFDLLVNTDFYKNLIIPVNK